ncbi:MAG TPA: phage holin family protein [Solirubrobacteraceae bacterium]|nr:phage holin family protein [Solirubrobacteraceae bacterium]
MEQQPPGGAVSSDARFARDAEDRSIADLVKELSGQTQTLVKQELELARAELTQKGKKAGAGAGMLGGAGLFGLFAFGALTTCFIALLATAIDSTWAAALIVAVVYGAIAGVLALTGKNRVADAAPPAPERAQASVKQDIASVKAHAQAGRH